MSDERDEALQLLSRELEDLIAQREDFLEITMLSDLAPWQALKRKLNAELNMQIQVVLGSPELATIRFHQGFVRAIETVLEVVADAPDQVKIRTDEITELQKQKDEIFAQEELTGGSALPPQYRNEV